MTSRDQIIFQIQRWVELYGDPPTQKEWQLDPDYPAPSTVKAKFGSWGRAIEAAGYRPRPRGVPRIPLERKDGRWAPY